MSDNELRSCTCKSYILPRYHIDSEEFLALREWALSRIDGMVLSCWNFDPEFLCETITLNVKDIDPEELDFLKIRTFAAGLDNCIVIEATASEPTFSASDLPKIQYPDGSEIEDEKLLSMLEDSLCDQVTKLIDGCFGIWNIAFGGALNTIKTFAECGEQHSESNGCDSCIPWAVNDDNLIDISRIPKTHPEKVLEWSLKCKGYWYGKGETNVEKSVCLLSRIFKVSNKHDSYPTLLWTIASLEALYCDSSSAIAYQIRRRAPLLSAEIRGHDMNKLINKGYGFRSRIFHGDIRMESIFAERDDCPDDHHTLKSSDHTDAFLAVAVSSIACCISNDWHEVTFEERLVI
ncbi:HEPN domain-containing protein [Sphingomicrobium aestuariivivum]|uniref:HEPN domain-containing protein n=1 Tax=Sphingomicrobium aestuariivivum TaxID=1582356 RepID=UPI001FD7050E|nr:HEPN domain-containing protein [Sphingomicrobium aestuariivivum]MCJ8190405.1 HEPN domain-containing protein [Sphingomicrobium aestuariivivum]